MTGILRIGAFSKMNHISIQTLRYYDEIGLLKPYRVDEKSNYRYYHIKQSAIIDAIQYLRHLDFSLKEVKTILSSEEEDMRFHAIIEARRQHLLAQRAEIDQKIQEIELFQKGLMLYESKATDSGFELLRLPEREIVTYDVIDNIYEMTDEDYELNLRYFKQDIVAYSPLYSNFSRVGSIMSEENFCQQRWESKQFFLFKEPEMALPQLKQETLPEGDYAVIYCASLEEELAMLPLFHQEIAGSDYQVAGPYICEVIYEHPILNKNARDMFIRMQVPVKI